MKPQGLARSNRSVGTFDALPKIQKHVQVEYCKSIGIKFVNQAFNV